MKKLVIFAMKWYLNSLKGLSIYELIGCDYMHNFYLFITWYYKCIPSMLAYVFNKIYFYSTHENSISTIKTTFLFFGIKTFCR